MKDKEFHAFEEEIELPDVVREKMEIAFRQIQTCPGENRGNIIRMREENPDTAKPQKRNVRFKRTVSAALCAALLAAGVITASAAAYLYWSRGMQGTLQASPQQQKSLKDNGLAIILNETNPSNAGNIEDAAETAQGNNIGSGTVSVPQANEYTPVTVGGVTVCPRMTVVTEDCAWISFSVDGFVPEKGLQPDFGTFDVSFSNEPDSDTSRWRNITARFYDGTIINENAQIVYDDGTAAEGPVEPRYADENGTMEFILQISGDVDVSLLGQSLHIRLDDLGTVARAKFTRILEGTWEFTIPLSGSNAYRTYQAISPIGDTGITVKQLELSPVSIRASLSVPEQVDFDKELISDMTHPCGVRLKDGTLLPYLSTGGGGGFTDSARTEFRFMHPFNHVIDLEQVDTLVFLKPNAWKSPDDTERFYIVPLEN